MRESCKIRGHTQAQSEGFSYMHTIHSMIRFNSTMVKKITSIGASKQQNAFVFSFSREVNKQPPSPKKKELRTPARL